MYEAKIAKEVVARILSDASSGDVLGRARILIGGFHSAFSHTETICPSPRANTRQKNRCNLVATIAGIPLAG